MMHMKRKSPAQLADLQNALNYLELAATRAREAGETNLAGRLRALAVQAQSETGVTHG
jgi:plasmid stabilization system protein ParE